MKRLLFSLLFFIPLVSSVSQERKFLDHLYEYIENTSVFEWNQEEGHVPLVPYTSTREALSLKTEQSASYLSLNGTWRFHYAETPEGTPAGFYETGFNDRNWNTITVPGNWEMQGFGDPLFRNTVTPFNPDPPRVPREYNPTGSYRRTFELPASWKGKQVFLRLEKVASASFIWINGKEAGYNEGAQEPAEYNITSYLRPGRNTIAVNVYKYADGYYLENQDYWRLAGIFDNVRLVAVPPVHISDWFATTDLDDSYRNARLSISVDVKSYMAPAVENYTVRATLFDYMQTAVQTLTSEEFALSTNGKHTIHLSADVMEPEKWSAEYPNLYTLVFELIDGSGKTSEVISGRIGFKETEIRNQVFYLNGQPVKLNGINSHMQHPDLGHAMDVETIRKDFILLKQFNINCVRTSHYPPVNEYLDLSDEYGIYIVDETGDEAHATEYVSDLPEWEAMYRERVRRMVLRDRNHPSVLFWSAGNESGEGRNICAVIEEGKKYDPTRYWMYGGNAFAHPCEEIIGPRYYTPFEMITLVGRVPDSVDPRPSFMDEYLSVAGNGGGGLDDYWELIRAYPRSMGGALWDFVSPGLRERAMVLQDASPNRVPVHSMGRARLTEGRTGRAIDLNGHDQWVEVYQDRAVEITGKELTLSLWVYPRALNASGGALLAKGSYQYGLRQTGKDSLEFYITTDKRHALRCALPPGWENNWHHVMAVYDGSRMQLIIDSVSVKSAKATGDIRNFPFPLNIGRNAEIHGQETKVYICDAVIDQVAIYANAMKPEELINPGDNEKKKACLWLDFEEMIEQEEFFSIGIGARTYGSVWPDRRPQPEMWQIKKSGQPVTARLINASEGLAEISNHYLFTNLRDLQTTWELSANGATIDKGALPIALAPGETMQVQIPFRTPVIEPGTDYRLVISFRQKDNRPWAQAGYEIAWEQFALPWTSQPLPVENNSHADLLLEESASGLVIKGSDFDYVFNKLSGTLVSMHYKGREMIRKGPDLNVWRPPLANETDEWGSHSSGVTHWGEGFGRMAATDWYTTGLHNLHRTLESFSYRKAGNEVVIAVNDIHTMANSSNGFQNRYIYTINESGEMTIQHTVIPNGDMPAWIPRVGTEWILSSELDQVQWYGRGPQENYPDRKSGYRIGRYSSTVNDMVEPYLIPQDYGLRTDVSQVSMFNAQGEGLQFSGGQAFNFSAWPYSRDNLTRALYTYQLKPFEGITFNFDYATSGVGCTARSVFNQYRVLPGRYDFVMQVKPVCQ